MKKYSSRTRFKDSYAEIDEGKLYRVCIHLRSAGWGLESYSCSIHDALEDGNMNVFISRFISDLKHVVDCIEKDIESLEEAERKI